MSKISIIIPVYNTEKLLRRCLNSVLNQTLKDIEIICVNDGSTDNSARILDDYGKYENIKIIEQKNSGLSSARNTGLDIATGKYIAFLDSDDFVDPDFYEKLFNNIEKYKADVACASIVRENDKKKTYLVVYKQIEVAKNIQDRFLLVQSPKYNFVWNKLYRKEFIDKNNLRFVPGMIYEDLFFTADVLETAGSLITVPDTYYHYWKYKDTLIKGNCDKYRADKLQGHQYLLEKCRKYNIAYSKRNELQYKKEYKFFGLLLLKQYSFRATEKFYLFGLIPFFVIEKKI